MSTNTEHNKLHGDRIYCGATGNSGVLQLDGLWPVQRPDAGAVLDVRT